MYPYSLVKSFKLRPYFKYAKHMRQLTKINIFFWQIENLTAPISFSSMKYKFSPFVPFQGTFAFPQLFNRYQMKNKNHTQSLCRELWKIYLENFCLKNQRSPEEDDIWQRSRKTYLIKRKQGRVKLKTTLFLQGCWGILDDNNNDNNNNDNNNKAGYKLMESAKYLSVVETYLSWVDSSQCLEL